MTTPPVKCWERKCVHYQGIAGGAEQDQVPVCKAFPDGIPDDIAYGANAHLVPEKGQGNDVVFEEWKPL